MARFSYTAADNSSASLMPRLPLTLSNAGRQVEVVGLLDTGSAVNVLPYHVGLALDAVWERQTRTVPLLGNLGRFEAKALTVMASGAEIISNMPVRFVFAWTRAEDAPVIFGQMNFFLEFDVCFYRSQGIFDVHLKAR